MRLACPLVLALGVAAASPRGAADAPGHTRAPRDHPHDLALELAAIVSHPLGARASAFAYFGLPGEPAVGPPAFMHRGSAMEIPIAPLGHHWLDSTHITYGTLTAGVIRGGVKLEASA